MGQSQFADAVTVVPAVAVKPEPRDVCTGFSGDEPALQGQAVGGLDADVFVIQIDVVGRVQQLCHREEYEPLFQLGPKHDEGHSIGDRRPDGKADQEPTDAPNHGISHRRYLSYSVE